MKTKIAVALLMLALVAACAQDPTGDATRTEQIRIGMIAPLSGGNAELGEQMIVGAEYAMRDLEGVELIVEDAPLEPGASLNAYRKLRDVNGVDAIIGLGSGVGNALAPAADQDRVLYCGDGVSDSAVVEGKRYVFRHWTTPEAMAERYVEELQDRGIDDIVAIGIQQSGFLAIIDSVEKRAGNIRIERVIVDQGTKDFRTELAKLHDTEADAFLLSMYADELTAVAQQLRQMGFEQPLTSIESFGYLEDVGLFEGGWYVDAASPSTRFAEEFTAIQGRAPRVVEAFTADCVDLLAQALEQGDADEAIAWIESLDGYDGAVGELTYRRGSIESPAVLKEIRDGETVETG